MSKEIEALETIGVNYSMCLEDVNHNEFVYVLKNSDEYALLEKAIKRNEPMKVNYPKKFMAEVEPCPNCGVGETVRWVNKTHNFCPHCGQKLDWVDENGI